MSFRYKNKRKSVNQTERRHKKKKVIHTHTLIIFKKIEIYISSILQKSSTRIELPQKHRYLKWTNKYYHFAQRMKINAE